MLKWLIVAVIVVALASGVHSASAHGKVDQQVMGPEFGALNIRGLRLEQTFRPQDTILSGVSLGLQRMNSGDANVTVTVRHGGSIGPIIGTSTVFFPDSAPGQPGDYPSPRKLVHFDFRSQVNIIANDIYVVQVEADSAGPGWAFLGYDAYPAGYGSFLGRAMSVDFVFQTCGSRGGSGEPCKSKTVLIDKFKKSRLPDCIDFDSTGCQP